MLYYIRNAVDDLIGFKYNNDIYYYVKNTQDDIIGILDSNHNLIAKYTYDSWGNILSITDSNNVDISSNQSHIANINPFRYRSYYYDSETKLYYLNSRYYNPLWGRFINSDGIMGANQDILSYNLYAYVSNNYVNLDDSSGNGLFAAALIGLAAGALAGFASQAISDTVNSVMSRKIKISSPQTYFGSTLGGGIAGVSSVFGAGPIAMSVISSGTASFTTNLLEKKSPDEIFYNTMTDIAIASVAGTITTNIPKITIGRNSYNSVFKSGLTKITNDTAKTMSSKVFVKGIAVEVSNDLLSSSINGMRGYVDDSINGMCKYPTVYWAN